jgi:hypothetical protein
MKPSDIVLHDVEWQMNEDVGGLYIRKDQIITDQFMDDLKDARFASKAPAKDFHKVASIPVAVVEKWMREGFNILSDKNITAAQIMKRLRAEGLDGFLATNKRV